MALLKFLLIFFLTLWLIRHVLGFVARFFLGNLAKQNKGQTFTYTYRSGQREQKPNDGNVHIDYAPKGEKGKNDDFKGGDYIDYEEVK